MKWFRDTCDFLVGVALIGGVPLVLFLGLTWFFVIFGPDWETMVLPGSMLYALFGQVVCFGVPLATLLKVIRYRRKRRVVSSTVLTAEVTCGILFAGAVIATLVISVAFQAIG